MCARWFISSWFNVLLCFMELNFEFDTHWQSTAWWFHFFCLRWGKALRERLWWRCCSSPRSTWPRLAPTRPLSRSLTLIREGGHELFDWGCGRAGVLRQRETHSGGSLEESGWEETKSNAWGGKNNIDDADKVCSELQLLQNWLRCFDPIPTESSDQATQAKSSSSWEGIADAKIQW